MNNTQKYENFVDYSMILNRSMRKIDTVFLSKPPKQMGSFNVTMENIVAIVNNLKEVQRMRNEYRKLATLDFVAKKDNKSARKAVEQINSIRVQLNQSYTRLKDEFFKQMDFAGRQCKEVGRAIKDKEEKARFNEASREFELMAYESKIEKFRIPINEQDELTQLRQDQARREHEEQEKQVDNITDFELQDTNKLESALSTIKNILAMTPVNDLSKEVRKEVAQIKKVLPPKTVTIAKDSLERLRHSSQLLLDLEQISEITKTTCRFMGSDGKLQKINRQLEALQPLLEKAIREEQQINMDIKQEHNDIQSKIDYATDAIRTYGNILDGNARLEQEKIRIGNNTHILYAENARLNDDEKKVYAEAQEIKNRPIDQQRWGDDIKVDQLYERARNDRQAINDNEAYMTERMSEMAVATLPPEYINMKKKLQSVSSLYQMQMKQEQELAPGGMLR